MNEFISDLLFATLIMFIGAVLLSLSFLAVVTLLGGRVEIIVMANQEKGARVEYPRPATDACGIAK